jgi:hypothetical protein
MFCLGMLNPLLTEWGRSRFPETERSFGPQEAVTGTDTGSGLENVTYEFLPNRER